MFKLAGQRPTNLGVRDGKLAPVPRKPNAVSSQADPGDKIHYIAPIATGGGSKTALAKLRKVIEGLPRTKVIEARDDYLYVEFSSALMGYVDDVEFTVDGHDIQMRSASRLGYSDMGANRKRLESIRAALV